MITNSDIISLNEAFEEKKMHGKVSHSYENGVNTGIRLEISFKKTEEIERFVKALKET